MVTKSGISPQQKLGSLQNLKLTEMEYCASAASMLAEEFWRIAE